MKLLQKSKHIIATIVCFSILISLAIPSFAAENDCTESHRAPDGYAYWKAMTGNTDQEVFTIVTVAGACALKFPGIGAQVFISTTLYSLLYLWNPTGEGRGDYVKYIYFDKSSSGFWEHTLFYTKDLKGETVYLGCTVDRYWVSNDC